MDTKKELEDFGTRFAGALLGMEESAAAEIIYDTVPSVRNSFPYNLPKTNIAPGDNLVVAGLSIPPWVIGYLIEEDGEKKGNTRNKDAGEALRKIGEGDVIYSLTMVLHHTIARNITNTFPLQARVGQPPPQRPMGSPVPATVVKL